MGIIIIDLSAAFCKEIEQFKGGRFTDVIDVRLVGEPDKKDATALEAFGLLVEYLCGTGQNEVRHARVDLTRKLDEFWIVTELASLPGQIEGIDGNAVAAETGPGIKWHEAEGL